MKKAITFAGVSAIALMALAGCSSVDTTASTPDQSISVSEYGLDEVVYQLPDERFVECFTSYLESQYATMSCEVLEGAPPRDYTQATEDFDIRYLTSARGKDYVCLEQYFESKYAVISCVPAMAR